MTVHLCRDFITQPTASSPGTNMYALALFMEYVLGYSFLSENNFSTSTYTISAGSDAEINLGGGQEYEVSVGAGLHTVDIGDVGRILVLKSLTSGSHNSGLFRVTGVNGGANSFIIDYRSLEYPPNETSLAWYLCEDETVIASNWQSGSNGNIVSGAYSSNSGSTSSKIMYRNPTSEWEVRLCLESSDDIVNSVGMSISPGKLNDPLYDQPDWRADDKPLHGFAYYDDISADYRGLVSGLGYHASGQWTSGEWHIFIVGDDSTGTTSMVVTSGSLGGSSTGWASFGTCEDEPLIAQRYSELEQVKRLYTVGQISNTHRLNWRFGFRDSGDHGGVAWSFYERPIPCVVSSYADNSNQSTHVVNASNAGDTPYNGTTELIDLEVLAGTLHNANSFSNPQVYEFEPRRLGRLPLMRQGRANFPDWTLSPSGSYGWLHTEDGVYLKWDGPTLTTGSLGNSLITGSSHTLTTVSNNDEEWGLQTYTLNDPAVPEITSSISQEITYNGKSIDATRYRKTYSYNRQEPRFVISVKQGSNPTKT